MLSALEQTGIIVSRAPGHTLSDFLNYSEAFNDHFICQSAQGEYRTVSATNTREVLNAEGNLFSMAGKGQYHALPLHGEFYFQSQEPPTFLSFFCVSASQYEGDTLFCDGQALFAQLPRSLQQCFSPRALRYRRYHDEARWQSQFQTHDKQEVTAFLETQGKTVSWEQETLCVDFLSPACRQREDRFVFVNNFLPFALRQTDPRSHTRARVDFHDKHPICADLVHEVAHHAKTLTRPHRWQPGDMVIVDNTRMMHGRNALNPQDPRHVLIRLGHHAQWQQKREGYAQAMARIFNT